MKFGMQAMSHPLVYLRPTRITYVRVTGPYETSIPQAWEKMFAWIDKNGLSSPVGHGFGLARDNPKIVDPKNCRYDACIEMKPHFEERAIRELGGLMIPGGSYCRLRRVGDYNLLRTEVASLHQTFEAPAGLQLDDKRPLVTIYLEDPRRAEEGYLRADHCVPVTAATQRGKGSSQAAA